MPLPDPSRAGYSTIPSPAFLDELRDDEVRDGFAADHVKTRLALLIKALRDQRDWSQAELGRRMGKPQNVVSRLEDPDYGKMSLQTLLEVASAFKLPLYIDLPEWDEWFRLMADMSARTMERKAFDADYLIGLEQEESHNLPDKPNVVAEPPVPQLTEGVYIVNVSEPSGVAITQNTELNVNTFGSVIPPGSQVRIDFPYSQPGGPLGSRYPTILGNTPATKGLAR